MTLEEAIQILYQKQLIYCRGSDSAFRGALNLGIEALERVKMQRAQRQVFAPNLLPGETKEEVNHADNKN